MDESLYISYMRELIGLMPFNVRFSERPIIAVAWQVSAIFLSMVIVIVVGTLSLLSFFTASIVPLSIFLVVLGVIATIISVPILAMSLYNFTLATIGILFWFLKLIGVPSDILDKVEDFINLYKLLFKLLGINVPEDFGA